MWGLACRLQVQLIAYRRLGPTFVGGYDPGVAMVFHLDQLTLAWLAWTRLNASSNFAGECWKHVDGE